MNNENGNTREVPAFIRRRMPNATEEELLEATDNVRRYLRTAFRIFERADGAKGGADSRESDEGDTIQRADDDSKI